MCVCPGVFICSGWVYIHYECLLLCAWFYALGLQLVLTDMHGVGNLIWTTGNGLCFVFTCWAALPNLFWELMYCLKIHHTSSSKSVSFLILDRSLNFFLRLLEVNGSMSTPNVHFQSLKWHPCLKKKLFCLLFGFRTNASSKDPKFWDVCLFAFLDESLMRTFTACPSKVCSAD